jgi:hypothetical protein
MGAVDGFLPIFAEGQKHIEALPTGVAEKVVGGHKLFYLIPAAG